MKTKLIVLLTLLNILTKAQLPLDTAAYSHVPISVQTKHYISNWSQFGNFDTSIVPAGTNLGGGYIKKNGTAANHLVLINEGGVAYMKGIEIDDCSYLDFIGYGSVDPYGFIMDASNNGFAVPIEGKSHHLNFYGINMTGGINEGFTAKIEVADFSGINKYKCDTSYAYFVQRDIRISNCKIRFNGSEAAYINSTGWYARDAVAGQTGKGCPIGTTNVFDPNDAADNITNTGTVTNKFYLDPVIANLNNQIIVQATVTKVSGTIAGNIVLSSGTDGITYGTTIQTQTLVNASNNYTFTMASSPNRYFRLVVNSSGTMAATMKAYVRFYFYPPPSLNIYVDSNVFIAPGRSSVNFSNLTNGYFRGNKGWHIGRELNTSQGKMLAAGGKAKDLTVTDNKVFGSFHNAFWYVAEGNIIHDRNYNDSAGYYGTVKNTDQTPGNAFGITVSRNVPVTWKIRNNTSYLNSAVPSTQYVLDPGASNTDTGNIICNNIGNLVIHGALVYSNNCGATNLPPIVNAGSNATRTLPTNTYQLNGSSSDPDGPPPTNVWSKQSGPTYTISNPNILNPILSNLLQGVYKFILTSTDNLGLSASDTMQLTINPAPVNNAPVANAGTDIPVQLPANSTQLNGSESDDVGVVSRVWSQLSGTAATISNTAILNPNITGLTTAGTRTFRLIVTDGGGLKDTDDVNVNVLPAANIPPVVNAGNDTTITQPASTINLVATATDDGSIASTLWSNSDGCSITSASSLSTTATCTTTGVHTFTFVATDNQTATSTDQKLATVNAAANINPVAIGAADQTIYLPKDSVILTQGGTDADGTITAYFSRIIKTNFSVTVNRPTTTTPAVKGLAAGDTIWIELKVTDNNNATGLDTTQVIVLADTTNTAPHAVINRAAVTIIQLPTGQVSIDGSASFDTDVSDYIASYLWEQTSGTPITMNGTNGSVVTLDGMVADVYGFRLTVTDSHGLSDFINFTITGKTILRFKIQRNKTRQ